MESGTLSSRRVGSLLGKQDITSRASSLELLLLLSLIAKPTQLDAKHKRNLYLNYT